MARERADLGFADALEAFDPADWTPRSPRPAPARPPAAETRKAAAAAGFRSREPQPAADPAAEEAAAPALASTKARRTAGGMAAETVAETSLKRGAGQGPRPRRRRTGRTAQLNLKVRPETIEAFYALADRQGWGLGEAFEHALRALEAAAGPIKPQK